MKTILFPGQGAQFRGMGKDLFAAYKGYTELASEILGYSIETLCVENPNNQLRLTQYTQPALYVVNALGFYKLRDEAPSGFNIDFVAGHSLGEFNALLAAGAFSFETGLKLVKKRGELMGALNGGAMAAVVGAPVDDVRRLLSEHRLDDIDLANFNTPTQVVLAGTMTSISNAEKLLSKQNIRCVILNVSAAFHSRHMEETQKQFAAYLREFSFAPPAIPVIANTTARPYECDQLSETLGNQIASPVRWSDSICYLLGQGEMEFIEIGSTILTKMVAEIQQHVASFGSTKSVAPIVAPISVDPVRATSSPLKDQAQAHSAANANPIFHAPIHAKTPPVRITEAVSRSGLSAETLGSVIFRQRYGLKYAYVAGAMYRGIASADLVIRMARAGFLSFYGSGGRALTEIEKAIRTIQSQLTAAEPYGMNLLANHAYPELELATVDLYLKYGIRIVEAAAFTEITPAIVLFRLKGLRRNASGEAISAHKIIAKVSRPEVAEAFMSPAPEYIVQQLLKEGRITPEQAELSTLVPISHDISIEADSGGHTDGGIPTVLLPAMLRLKQRISDKYSYYEPICMGLGGGIGSPEAAAAALLMGADFILTGSINQCTVEAGISSEVKNMLQDINVQDTDYAPAGDMFEMGAKVQVLKKGVFFPTRAQKLFSLYTHYNRLDDIPEKTQRQLQSSFFKKSFDDVWSDTVAYLKEQRKEHEISKAEANPKHKMALVFRWYFAYSTRLALEGKGEDRVNYQVHTGPALGAFNQWVKGTEMEAWTNRHVDEIGKKLMTETAHYLANRLALFSPFRDTSFDSVAASKDMPFMLA